MYGIFRSRLGHGGGGAGGGTGPGADPNGRVLAVLAQMGLDGVSQLPDGSIRLPDGRIVGNFGLDGEGSGADGSDADDGEAGWGGRGAYATGILKGVPASVQMMVQGLETEICGVKKKFQVIRVFGESGIPGIDAFLLS